MAGWRGRSGSRIGWLLGLLMLWLTLLPASTVAATAAPPAWPPPGDGILVNDPSVVWGRLANGLRYAIMPNATPPGRVSLRLLVEAGSLMEEENQRGLAHFLEHMAFKGSTTMPPGELIGFLQRAGLAFGPDTNAQTGFDSTVYQLDLPRPDADLVAEGIAILSDFDGRLLIASDQIETERGVILSEKRLRDTPGSRAFEATLDFLMPDSRYAARIPIGLEEVIRTAPRERFAAFYHDWYTPERSVVVVTGDVAPAAIQALIEKHFAGFAQPADAPADPTLSPVRDRGLAALLLSDPGLPATVSLNRALPYDARPDSLAKESDALRLMLANQMLARRLESIGLRAGAPFTGSAVGLSDLPPEARLLTMRLRTTPDGWRAALAAGEQELRRALEHGFSQDELDQALTIFRHQLEAAAASASTRDSADLAEQLVDAIAHDQIFTSPANDLLVFAALAGKLKPADIDAALHRLWDDEQPAIIVQGPIEIPDAEATILDAFAQSRKVPVAPPEALATATLAYHDFGPASAVTTSRHIDDLDIHEVTFANGVELEYKATAFEADTIHVAVRFGSGRIGLPKDQPGLDLLAKWGFVDGGLGRQSIEQITRAIAAREADLDLMVSDSSLVMTGATTRRDLDFQLDILAAYASDAGYRREAMERFQQRLTATYARLAAVPEGALRGPVALLLHDGDTRFGMPPEAEARQRTLDELRAWLEPMLKNGPMQVVLVGDFDPAAAVAAVGRTFGALPARGPGAPPPAPPELAVPTAAEPVRFAHQGPEGQAVAAAFWPTDSQRDPKVTIGLDLVADILGDRLLREVRQHEGATYSPETWSDMSLVLPGFGYLGAVLDVAAPDAPRLAGLIQDVGARMQAGGITADEFDRAIQPRLAQARTALQTNDYWFFGVLVGMAQFPDRLDHARHLIADTEAQTLASVQALASRYLLPHHVLPVMILPAAGTAKAESDP